MKKKTKKRRSFSNEQKAAILRRHFVDKVPVSDLCDEYKLQPSLFYSWQALVYSQLVAALDAGAKRRGRDSRETKLEQENETLKARLANKDGVIAEISEEFVKLKKAFGEP